MTTNKSFDPPKFKCKDCQKVIFSRFEGEFVACDCVDGNYIAVDYTRHYGRHIGRPEKFEEYKGE